MDSVAIGNVPQWFYTRPHVDLSMTEENKQWCEEDNVETIVYQYISNQFYYCLAVYKVGSKSLMIIYAID